MKRYSLIITLSIIFFGIGFFIIPADALISPKVVRFTPEAIIKGYTIHYNQTTHPEWGDFFVGIYPNLVNEPITVEVKQFDDNLPDPPGLKRVSDYYIYDMNNETVLTPNWEDYGSIVDSLQKSEIEIVEPKKRK